MAKKKAEPKEAVRLSEEERKERDDREWHRKKHADLDKMIDKARRKAERMERINPRTKLYPALTVEEVEKIEGKLPKVRDFTDEEMIKVVASEKDVSVEEAAVMVMPDVQDSDINGNAKTIIGHE